jgi:hypothetical protein
MEAKNLATNGYGVNLRRGLLSGIEKRYDLNAKYQTMCF